MYTYTCRCTQAFHVCFQISCHGMIEAKCQFERDGIRLSCACCIGCTDCCYRLWEYLRCCCQDRIHPDDIKLAGPVWHQDVRASFQDIYQLLTRSWGWTLSTRKTIKAARSIVVHMHTFKYKCTFAQHNINVMWLSSFSGFCIQFDRSVSIFVYAVYPRKQRKLSPLKLKSYTVIL